MTSLVVLSGGLDSTVAAAAAAAEVDDVAAVSFFYGQRHRKELTAAAAVAKRLRIRHNIVNLEGLLHGSALLDDTVVPHGHYAEASMTATVVPGRNLLFAAAAIARAHPGDQVWFGVHAGDHPIYPDCRPDFWDHLHGVVLDAYSVWLTTPFLHLSKADIVTTGHRLDAPMDLSWSCYEGGPLHCGRCGTCVERAEAFHLADVEDPTRYEDPAFWRTAVRA